MEPFSGKHCDCSVDDLLLAGYLAATSSGTPRSPCRHSLDRLVNAGEVRYSLLGIGLRYCVFIGHVPVKGTDQP
jgi:hypothetical protein